MQKIKQFSKILIISILISSCKTSINKKYPINNSEEIFNENTRTEKKRMEI